MPFTPIPQLPLDKIKINSIAEYYFEHCTYTLDEMLRLLDESDSNREHYEFGQHTCVRQCHSYDITPAKWRSELVLAIRHRIRELEYPQGYEERANFMLIKEESRPVLSCL